jgi:hypothetical protein
VTLVVGLRALPQKTQPDSFIILQLIHDDFLPSPFPFIADQSHCLSKGTAHSSVQCTESCIKQGARK